MTAHVAQRAARRVTLTLSTICIVAGSQLGMLWLAYAYLTVPRESDVVSPEALLGMVAIVSAVSTARLSGRRIFQSSIIRDPILVLLLTFLGVCIVGELLQAAPRLGNLSTFISLGAFYLIGSAAGRWLVSGRARMAFIGALLCLYSLWYLGLAFFLISGDLGFYGVLPDSDLLRLEFRSGFTATELPIYVGFQMPILMFVLLADNRIHVRLWAGTLALCALLIVALSASSAALMAVLLVWTIGLIARHGTSLGLLLRACAAVILLCLLVVLMGNGIIESVQTKLESFVAGEGTRSIIYANLLDIIANEPRGIGKGRFVETNSFSWLGEGVYPHHNILGIGAEMGWIALALFVALLLLVHWRLGRVAFSARTGAPRGVRVLVSAVLGVFVYQQFRGLFQDTWILKETYFWLGLAGGVIATQVPTHTYLHHQRRGPR